VEGVSELAGWRVGVVGAVLAAMAAAPIGAAVITRGPYLQRVSRTEAIVRWRTDVPTFGRVWWGSAPGALEFETTSLSARTEHRMVIGALSPRQTVYYAVGDASGVLAGDDADHRFVTARSAGDWRPLRLWILGDSGTADAGAAAVRDGFALFAGGVPPDLWMMLGDNAYLTGTDAQYQAAVFDLYPDTLRAAALWPALGNHDAISSDAPTQTGPFFSSFSLPRAGEAGGRASGTEAWYSFEVGQVHLVVLDSADSSLAPGSPMLTWLDLDLAANRRPWTIVAFHHPPYTKGSHDSDDPTDSGGRMIAVRERVLPILEARGVDLVLSGHSHGYERSYLLDGHYGPSASFEPWMRRDGGDGDPDGDGPYRKSLGAHGGTVYVVAGSSGRVQGTIEEHPAIAVGLELLGSLVIDVASNRLDVRFVTATGAVADRFALVDGDLVFADGFETGDSSVWDPPAP
jgi:hypothetical protein